MEIAKILMGLGFGILGLLLIWGVGNLIYISFNISLKNFIYTFGVVIAIVLVFLGLILDMKKVEK